MLTTTFMVLCALAALLCGVMFIGGRSAPLVSAAETASNNETRSRSVAFDGRDTGADAGYDSGGGGD